MGRPKRRQSPKKAAFIAELAINGGNLTKAAEAVGYNGQHGRRLAKDPEVVAALAQSKQLVESTLTKWADMQEEARKKMFSLMMNAEDERVQLLAAKEIIDRHEGKATTRVEHSGEVTQRVIEDEGVMMAILTLMGRKQWSLAQATSYVMANPKEVQQWMKALPAGKPQEGEVQDAEFEVVDAGDSDADGV